jgi:long-chain acyl-CoA synthetase
MAESTAFRSLAELFLHRVSSTPDREAFRTPDGSGWQRVSWQKVGESVRAIACGLRALGLRPEERCAILSSTRLDWILADLAIVCAAGATTTIYPSNTADECAFVVEDSGAAFVIAEDAKQLEKLRQHRARLRTVRKVIVIDGPGDGDWVVTLAEVSERGRAADAANPAEYEQVARAVEKTHLATLIYTSGTTGRPRGVELIHDCWLYEAEAIEALGLVGPDDLQYLWLPLSHSFGKVLETTQLRLGFASAVDGRLERLVDNLPVVRPTFVAAVPRVFEKVHNKVVAGVEEKGGAALRIFHWAERVGARYSAALRSGQEPGGLLALQYRIADRLVFSKLRNRFGGQLRFFFSGAAPLSREIAEFFHAAGILICEGYGLTESSAATFCNRPQKFKLGTVGLPLPGTEVKIAASDGEILVRGRGVMRGYHGLAAETAEVLDADRWLHTGDIGELDADGFLRITDRKKDLIKTAGGKYVAPQMIEGRLKAACPYVSQAVVHGNGRNYCTALLSLDADTVRAWAATRGLGGLEWAQLVAHDEVRKLVQTGVDEVNNGLASYETIKKFALLPQDLSQDAGELTASLKVKRKVVEEHYRPLLDGMYAERR